MTVWRLVMREITARPLQFLLGMLSVMVAIGCLVAELTLLHAHDLRTEQIVAPKEAQMRGEMASLEDAMRQITVKQGFDILILPKEQSVANPMADGYDPRELPEDYAGRLAQSKVITVSHLLPVLQQKVKWPERKRTVLLIGTRGEVAPPDDKKPPILPAVAPGHIVLGYELHASYGVKTGDRVTFMGRTFTVSQCYEERMDDHDVSVWMNLREAQELLGKPGLINAIYALSCKCEGDQTAIIYDEVARILPDTQVKRFATKADTRIEVRRAAAETARQALEAEKAGRAALREERERFAALLVPLVVLGCMVWIAVLAFLNVRERRAEIGILRAIGVRSSQVLALFLTRAVALGLAGALLGYAGGFLVGSLAESSSLAPSALFTPTTLAIVLVLAPLLAVLASWFPAFLAAQEDPADVLQEE